MAMDDSARRMFKSALPLILAVVVAVAAIVVPRFVSSGWAADEAAVKAKVEGARTQTEQAEAKANETQNEAVHDATGFDASRKATDEEAIRKFLSTACTWTSQKTYAEARDKIKNTYALSEDSKFMTDFMPVIEADSVNGHGEVVKGVNQIDSRGLNLALGDCTFYLEGMDGDVYRYVTKFELKSTDTRHTVSSDALLTCAVSSDGNVVDPIAVRI